MSFISRYSVYLKNNPERYWFKRKAYGWGWVPATWQGWTLLGAYVALDILFALTIDERSSPREVVFTFALPVALLTGTLLRICYATGEPPKWQWGIPDDDATK